MPDNYSIINMNNGDDWEDNGCELGGLYESRGNAK
jgi:hypothetical protein